MLEAGRKTVPKGRGRRRPKPWWTEEVALAMRERQRLEEAEDYTREGRRRLEEVKKDLEQRIAEGRRKQWHEKLGDINSGKNYYKDLWRMVHVMDGKLPPARPNPILREGEREHVLPEEKAEALAKFYEGECTLPKPTRRQEELERSVRERMGEQTDREHPAEGPLTMEELETALRVAKKGKAAGRGKQRDRMESHRSS